MEHEKTLHAVLTHFKEFNCEYFNKLRKTEQFLQLNCFRYFDYLKSRTN